MIRETKPWFQSRRLRMLVDMDKKDIIDRLEALELRVDGFDLVLKELLNEREH